MNPLYIAASGMVAQETRVDVIANNLANMNTTGYQKRRAAFNDLLYQNDRRPNSIHSRADGIVPGGVKAGAGVRVAAAYRIMEQGNLKQTGNPLDIAIQGNGYFQVTLPNGQTAYTRAGAFQINQNGTIVTHDGNTVGRGITVPPAAQDITINQSGEVLAKLASNQAPVSLGQLQLARFRDEGALKAVGDNLFQATPESGAAQTNLPGSNGFGTVQQGFLETSNVNPVEEISNLIQAQRAYELNSKVIQTADQIMSDKPSA